MECSQGKLMEAKRRCLNSKILEDFGKQGGCACRRTLTKSNNSRITKYLMILRRKIYKHNKHERGRYYAERLRELFLPRQKQNKFLNPPKSRVHENRNHRFKHKWQEKMDYQAMHTDLFHHCHLQHQKAEGVSSTV